MEPASSAPALPATDLRIESQQQFRALVEGIVKKDGFVVSEGYQARPGQFGVNIGKPQGMVQTPFYVHQGTLESKARGELQTLMAERILTADERNRTPTEWYRERASSPLDTYLRSASGAVQTPKIP